MNDPIDDRRIRYYEKLPVLIRIDDPDFALLYAKVGHHLEQLDCQPDPIVSSLCKWIEKKVGKR